jgi:ribonuclease T2
MLIAFTRRLACAAIIGCALSAPDPSAAQDRRQGEPGQFDYYVLVLSWSPSFCADS